jgi:hypothetical protein
VEQSTMPSWLALAGLTFLALAGLGTVGLLTCTLYALITRHRMKEPR